MKKYEGVEVLITARSNLFHLMIIIMIIIIIIN